MSNSVILFVWILARVAWYFWKNNFVFNMKFIFSVISVGYVLLIFFQINELMLETIPLILEMMNWSFPLVAIPILADLISDYVLNHAKDLKSEPKYSLSLLFYRAITIPFVLLAIEVIFILAYVLVVYLQFGNL